VRLIAAELLKLRHRTASYVVLLLLVGLMALVYLVITIAPTPRGASAAFAAPFLRFPGAYAVINQFVFGLGSLFATAYAAAIAGSDWTWGMPRVFVARGESRSGYVLAKLAGLGIVLLIGTIIAIVAGGILSAGAATAHGYGIGDPLSGPSLGDLWRSIALGFPVLAERAAIGFMVAIVLRSQLAGVIAGIGLYIGEAILRLVITVIEVGSRFGTGVPIAEQTGPQWHQFLPFSIGDSVLQHAPSVPATDPSDLLSLPVGMPLALIVVLLYLAAATAIALISVERAEIAG